MEKENNQKLLKAKKVIKGIILNKWVVFTLFWIGLIYVTVYGFLRFPDVKSTASQIGLDYPLAFKFWGLLSGLALSSNINYLYHKHHSDFKLGYVLMFLGCACIMTTVHIPSTEIMSLQLVAHWGTALLFGVFFAAAIILFMIKQRKIHKAYYIGIGVFGATLALMIILLICFGKSGIIESIPIWGAYALLFLLNFTKIFPLAKEESQAETSINESEAQEENTVDIIEDGKEKATTCSEEEREVAATSSDDSSNPCKRKSLEEMTLSELWELFPIILAPYNEEYPKWFAEEYTLLKAALPESAIIEHVGSTAIKGIRSKPTVDILAEVKPNDFSAANDGIIATGYHLICESDNRKDYNKGYTEYGFADKVYHLHLRIYNDNDELYFRDYLNKYPDVAEQYEKLKLSLWKPYEHNRDGYTEQKGDFVRKYTLIAKNEFPDLYKREV